MAYSWLTPIDLYVWIGNTGFILCIINLWFMSDNCPTVHPLKWKSDERQSALSNLGRLDFYLCWSTWSVISISISLSLFHSHWVYSLLTYMRAHSEWVRKIRLKTVAWPTDFPGQLILESECGLPCSLKYVSQGCFQPLKRAWLYPN